MGEIYRFRTVEQLLGESLQELETQTIYFASPDKLNDPMEGFRDIVWRGDSIVWSNFFKHFVFCLYRTYLVANAIGDTCRLILDDIPVFERWDKSVTEEEGELFSEIWSRAVNDLKIDDLSSKIAQLRPKVRFNELMWYLRGIHFKALRIISEVCVDRGYLPSSALANLPSLSDMPVLSDSDYFRIMQGLIRDDSYTKLPPDERDKFVDTVFSIPYQTMGDLLLSVKYDRHRKRSDSVIESNYRMMTFDFSELYLRAVEKLLWPQWYAACFTGTFSNSSMWGNYAANHKGVCLIFETDDSDETPVLSLKQTVARSGASGGEVKDILDFSPMAFSRVSYEDKPGEVDFFRSIGVLPTPALMKLWYTDESGNVSECSTHSTGAAGLDAWRKIYWEQFERDITIKTKDWRYEEEERLILYSSLDNALDGRRRTTTYRFDSLVGIIFGIMTPDEHKLKIMEVIEGKCRESGRTGFNFYQAYYSHEDGDIQRSPIGIEFV